jgi:hypothetical protein
MRFRKPLFAIGAGLAVLITLIQVPQARAAQAVVLVRPYYRFYGPNMYYPYYYYPSRVPQVYAAVPRLGEVKIDTRLRDASVYIDGGFAGRIQKLRKFSLQPGNHDIQIRNAGGQELFSERVQVLAGKTVEIKL